MGIFQSRKEDISIVMFANKRITSVFANIPQKCGARNDLSQDLLILLFY